MNRSRERSGMRMDTSRPARAKSLAGSKASRDRHSVTISYARADGRALADRLCKDLRSEGIQAWMDVNEIDGGAAWTQQIEQAIDGSRCVLALLSHASYQSPICRAEQLRALRKGVPVVPLLVQPDADRPLHLEGHNLRDLSDPGTYRSGLQLLLADIAAPGTVRLNEEFRVTRRSVPSLPPIFLPRNSALRPLRQLITREAGMPVVGLHGMGGSGKTVLAQALCADTFIQDAFPGGIIWLTLASSTTDLLEQLREAGRCLRDSPDQYPTVDAGANRLRTMLEKRAVLLVLDDVVKEHQLCPFLPDKTSAPGVRVLFTTRDTSVGSAWGATMLPAPALEAVDAEALIELWAGRRDPASAALARRLAHLPLALKIAGALMKSDGRNGSELLVEFEHVSHLKTDRYADTPDTNVSVCFDVSLKRLPDDDRQRYEMLGLLPRRDRVPLKLAAALWRGVTPDLSDRDAADIARAFEHRALLAIEADRVTLHPLLHEYAAERVRRLPALVSGAANGLHQAMLDADWIVRERAIEALALIGGEPAFQAALGAAVEDDDPDVRIKGLRLLAQQPDPRAIPGLIMVLLEGYYETTIGAAQALAAIGSAAVEPVIAALPRLTGTGLTDGVRALGWIGDARAISVLERIEADGTACERVTTSTGEVIDNVATQALEQIRRSTSGKPRP